MLKRRSVEMFRENVLSPANRHVQIVPHLNKGDHEESAVLLPEDYQPEEDRYVLATLVSVAPDCSKQLLALKRGKERSEVLVDRAMIEKIECKGKVFHLVLENYIVGIFSGVE